MSDTAFVPTLYVKNGCPFSLKARLFLLESGLLGEVKVVEGATPEEHQRIADDLTAKMGKASFPTAEIEPDVLLSDSDALVEYFAKTADVDPGDMPTYQAYANGVFPRLMQLHSENSKLKQSAN